MDVGLIGIKPFDPVRVQPVSYDVTLSAQIRVPREDVTLIRTKEWATYDPDCTYWGHGVPSWRNHTTEDTIGPRGWILRPGAFILACTEEYVKLDPTIAAMVEGKSSLGRLGMTVHVTAGVIDPGFEGQITLEIRNLAPWAIELHEGMPIAQLVFDRVNRPQYDYSEKGRYQGQTGPTESRYKM